MDNVSPIEKNRGGCLKIGLLMIGVAIVTSLVTLWVAKVYLFPREFKPVQLSASEEKRLDLKIEALTSRAAPAQNDTRDNGRRTKPNPSAQNELKPEPYSEKDANREIHLTERELNGLLAKNTDLARKLVIDLSDDLASVLGGFERRNDQAAKP